MLESRSADCKEGMAPKSKRSPAQQAALREGRAQRHLASAGLPEPQAPQDVVMAKAADIPNNQYDLGELGTVAASVCDPWDLVGSTVQLSNNYWPGYDTSSHLDVQDRRLRVMAMEPRRVR